jgi:hypothetical protein
LGAWRASHPGGIGPDMMYKKKKKKRKQVESERDGKTKHLFAYITI